MFHAPQVDDAITEALENDNLQLQNMSGQKYVQTNSMFLDAVAKWQKNLGTVDSVLSCWQDVQKKWQVCGCVGAYVPPCMRAVVLAGREEEVAGVWVGVRACVYVCVLSCWRRAEEVAGARVPPTPPHPTPRVLLAPPVFCCKCPCMPWRALACPLACPE